MNKYNVEEVAKIMGVSTGTVHGWIRCGRYGYKLKATRDRYDYKKSQYIIAEEDLITFKNNNKDLDKYKKRNFDKKSSLCWRCKKSTPKLGEPSCSWCEHREPVSGWTAEKHIRPTNGKCKESYFVFSCPGFEPDDYDHKQISANSKSDGVVNLAEALLDSTAQVYMIHLKNFNANTCTYTANELTQYERNLNKGLIPKILPGNLTISSYITHMRELYLSKFAIQYLTK